MQLTDKQKELFQLDKYVLVDTIIILEDKLQNLRNEMLLNSEAFKAELETERSMRVRLEKAHITAQEEIDVLNKGVDEISKLDNDAFLHALQDKIDKFRRESLASREEVIREKIIWEKKNNEEGWNGEL